MDKWEIRKHVRDEKTAKEGGRLGCALSLFCIFGAIVAGGGRLTTILVVAAFFVCFIPGIVLALLGNPSERTYKTNVQCPHCGGSVLVEVPISVSIYDYIDTQGHMNVCPHCKKTL